MCSEQALPRVARPQTGANRRAFGRSGRAAAVDNAPAAARPRGDRLGIRVVAPLILATTLLLGAVLAWSLHLAAHQAAPGLPAASDPRLILQPRTAVQSAQVGGLRLTLTASPLIPGSNHFELRLGDRGRPVDDARIRLIATMPGMGGHSLSYQARAIGEGRYAVSGPLTMFGHWRIAATVSRPGAAALTHAFGLNLDIPSGAFQAAAASNDTSK
jgi:YtkA-like